MSISGSDHHYEYHTLFEQTQPNKFYNSKSGVIVDHDICKNERNKRMTPVGIYTTQTKYPKIILKKKKVTLEVKKKLQQDHTQSSKHSSNSIRPKLHRSKSNRHTRRHTSSSSAPRRRRARRSTLGLRRAGRGRLRGHSAGASRTSLAH